jgi:hypothetical protein
MLEVAITSSCHGEIKEKKEVIFYNKCKRLPSPPPVTEKLKKRKL